MKRTGKSLGQEYAYQQDRLVHQGKLTRFRVLMEFEVEVRGGKVSAVSTTREAADLSHEVASKLVVRLRRATGRKSIGIGQSGTSVAPSMYALKDENPLLPVDDQQLKYVVPQRRSKR